MTGPEIFMIGVFCGAYGMFTLIGVLWCGKHEPTGRTVDTDGQEQ